MTTQRVTVLDLMAQASASTPPSGAAAPPAAPPSSAFERAPAAADEDPIERVERLTGELEAIADPHARAVAEELMAAVLELYGRGLERIVTLAGEDTARAMSADGVVGSLMLIHDLYPVPLDERVAEALDSVRPYMESHGGNVELLGIDAGVVKLRLEGSCKSCAASSATLELAIKKALMEHAPDLDGMDVEGVAPEPPAEMPGTPLPLAPSGNANGSGNVPALSSWHDVEGVADLAPGALRALMVGQTPVVVGNVAGTLLAYADRCAACGAPLNDAVLADAVLTCAACAQRFDLPRAGRGLDDGSLQLQPVPLLRDGESRVRVALAS